MLIQKRHYSLSVTSYYAYFRRKFSLFHLLHQGLCVHFLEQSLIVAHFSHFKPEYFPTSTSLKGKYPFSVFCKYSCLQSREVSAINISLKYLIFLLLYFELSFSDHIHCSQDSYLILTSVQKV